MSLGNNDTNQKTISDFTGSPSFGSTETTKTGWSTVSSCTGDQGQSNLSAAGTDTATFRPDPGETITCTFTNTEKAKLITKKVVVSSTHPNQTFSFDGTAITDGPVSLGNNDTNEKTISDFSDRKSVV